MKTLKKLSAIFLAVTVLLCCLVTGASAADENDKTLRFRDGKFKILVLADIQDTNRPKKKTTELMLAAIEQTKPDLIVLTGDNTAGKWAGVTPEKTKQAIGAVAKEINDRKIPFALVFGNHDHEGLCQDSIGMETEEAKELMLSWYQEYEYCLAVEGEEMTGVGNYNIPIKSSVGDKNVFNLWFIDSNPYSTEEEGGGYGFVHKDQIEWYERTSNELKAANGGKPLPALSFQHIIVPECYDMFTEVAEGTENAVEGNGEHSGKYYIPNPDFITEGALRETPGPANSANDGQFDSWVKQGDVIGAVFGHDHVNDYVGTYKGVRLVSVPGTTYFSYGGNRGVRTLTLDENDLSTFDTELLTLEKLVPGKYRLTNAIVKDYAFSDFLFRYIPFAALGLVALAGLITAAVFIVKHFKKKKKSK